jgi:N-carbamoylputrescine amidase
MKVAALGIVCPDPWETLLGLPPVDLVVLPELCFTPWLCATPQVDPLAWEDAAANQHLHRLPDLGARVVIGTKATVHNGRRFNDAFCWTRDTGLRTVHRKTFLPDEQGFWEATWYRRGPVDFQAFDTPVGRIGVSVCTEMWFTQQAYPDVDLVIIPRATPIDTTDKWLAGGATHAVCSGAFCVSSNRSEQVAGTTMGGAGWVFDPEGAELGVTTAARSALVIDVDLDHSRAAKATYPRYVRAD